MAGAKFEPGRKVRIRRSTFSVDLLESLGQRLGPFACSRRSRVARRKIREKIRGKLPEDRGGTTSRWEVVDLKTGVVGARFDSFEAAKRFCVKNDFDFGQYGRISGKGKEHEGKHSQGA